MDYRRYKTKTMDWNALITRNWVNADSVNLSAENEQKRAYLAGKISGLNYNKAVDDFMCYEARIKAAYKFDVVNPVKICRATWSWLRCMAVCIYSLLQCDVIFLMPNWQDSKGAKIEYLTAKLFHIKIVKL